MFNVLWLITARSGSKGIPDKNIKLLGGMPLLSYRIKSALAISTKDNVWVSTDSKKYAKIAREYGGLVPFIRPSKLATDTAKSVDVVLHAMDWANSSGLKYDAIGLLEPTSPFIKPFQLVNAVKKLLSDKSADSIVAVREVRPSTFYIQKEKKYLSAISKRINSKGILRRQDEKREITPSGGFYISKWDVFSEKKTFYSEQTLSHLVSDLEGLEIDEPIDFLWAEFLIEKGIIKPSDIFHLEE